MMSHEDYFEGVSVKKISIIVACVISWMIIFGMFRSYAQDNVTEDSRPAPEILVEGGEWPTQLVYDTITGCYQGTVSWIVMSNPALIGTEPPPDAQRKMLVHCYCILDKIRVQYTFVEYFKRISNPVSQDWIGTYFMAKALECVKDYNTLEGIIIVKDLSDNQTITKPEQSIEDSKEEVPLPKQPVEESEDEEPNTLFQG